MAQNEPKMNTKQPQKTTITTKYPPNNHQNITFLPPVTFHLRTVDKLRDLRARKVAQQTLNGGINKRAVSNKLGGNRRRVSRASGQHISGARGDRGGVADDLEIVGRKEAQTVQRRVVKPKNSQSEHDFI